MRRCTPGTRAGLVSAAETHRVSVDSSIHALIAVRNTSLRYLLIRQPFLNNKVSLFFHLAAILQAIKAVDRMIGRMG